MIFLHWVWLGVWQHRTLNMFCWEELNWSNLLWKCFCWEVHSWQTMTRCTQGLWERQRLHQWDSLPWQVERWIQNKAQNIGYWNVYKIKPTPYKDAQKTQWVKAALARKRVSTGGVQSKAQKSTQHKSIPTTSNSGQKNPIQDSLSWKLRTGKPHPDSWWNWWMHKLKTRQLKNSRNQTIE